MKREVNEPDKALCVDEKTGRHYVVDIATPEEVAMLTQHPFVKREAEDDEGQDALEAAIIERLGDDAPANAMIQWGTVKGGAVLRIDLIDPHAGVYVAAGFVHEAEAEPATIAAMLRTSIYLNRGDFAPDDGFLG